MTIIVFLIDTNASMMQKTYLGTSHLDFSRQAVEQFLKQRQRDPGCKGDRYMLMTFDEFPLNVKSGWKETQAIFTEQLKNLRVGSLCGFGSAVESALRFVNLNRMQSGIENYGYGRYPCYSEHVVIIAVTVDEGAEASSSSQADGFTFTKQAIIGSELTTEPYRWDQRLFTLVLRLPGQANIDEPPYLVEPAAATTGGGLSGAASPTTATVASTKVPSATGPIDALCTAMGGRSFAIKSHRMLSSTIETIIQHIQQNGVMIQLQKYGSDPPTIIVAEPGKESKSEETIVDQSNEKDDAVDGSSWSCQKVMLILKPNKQGQGHWPIPEAYSADSVSASLPARMAHPTILFRCENAQPMIVQDFPFDKYELSNSPLSQYILSRQDPAICWQVYVENSSRIGGIGMPFGYLKPASNMQSVILFLMPYNYPALLPLLEETRNSVMTTGTAFRQKMEKYLMTVPPYYYSPLRKAFKRIGLSVPFLEDSNLQVYSYGIVSLMTRIKHVGKEELEAACAAVAKNLEAFPPALLNGPQFVKASHCRVTNPLKTTLLETELRPSLQTYLTAIPQIFKDVKICVNDGNNTGVGLTPMLVPSAQFKNPFDIERRAVISQLDKMRLNFDQLVETNALHVLQGGMPGQKIKLQHAEDLHNQPISKMGDYQEYVRCLSSIGAGPLRELEPQAARPHAFGNPFKLDKKSIAVDEVGEMTSAINNNNNNGEGRSERRVRSQSAPVCSAGGMAGSFSSVPVAIRSKRKPGAIDPALLTSWKRRRRSSSVASDGSSSASELEDLLQDYNNEAEYKIIDDDSGDEDACALTIFESGGEDSTDSSTSSNGAKNGLISTGLKSPKRETNHENEHEHEQQKAKRCNVFLDLNGRNDEDISTKMAVTPQMTAGEMCRKQLELSKAVRGIGDKYFVFNRCVNALKDVENIHERHFLLRFAMSEARRFKRSDLIKQIDMELKVISSGI